MSYTDKILLANEKIIYQGKRSVFPKLPYIIGLSLIFPFISVLGTLAVFFDKNILNLTGLFTGIFLGVIVFIILYLLAKLIVNKTELVITNRRIIAKFGIIRLDTLEIRLENIESIGIEQTFLGRLFNYGTIIIHGYGGSNTPIIEVINPLKFKRELEQLHDTFQT